MWVTVLNLPNGVSVMRVPQKRFAPEPTFLSGQFHRNTPILQMDYYDPTLVVLGQTVSAYVGSH